MMYKFIKTNKCGCINTTIIIPHHECYLIQYGCLLSELIDGYTINLGEIECVCNHSCNSCTKQEVFYE